MAVFDTKYILSPMSLMTPEGGFAVLMTNDTGGVSVKGTVVQLSSATNSVKKIVVDTPNPMGVIYNDGVANGGQCWVVVSGLAETLFIGNTTANNFARGFVSGDAGYITGYALGEPFPTSPFATDKHFFEIGHITQSRTGAGLAFVNLHFN